MDAVKHKIIYLFFIHVFLRRIGKRYPEFFKSWLEDYLENPTDRRILTMRYTGVNKTKFAAIAIELGMDECNVFRRHKKAIERLISE